MNYGRISIIDLESSINRNTNLITIMFENNEKGTIQNIKEISRITRK